MTNRHTDAITTHAVQVESNKHIANIRQVISESNYKHRDAREARHLTEVLNCQPVALAGTILRISRKRVYSLTRQQIETHRKNANARARVVAEFDRRG